MKECLLNVKRQVILNDVIKPLLSLFSHHSGWERMMIPTWFVTDWLRNDRSLKIARKQSKLVIGPVYSEFGHVLLHILPFLCYCHYKLGIQKIVVCTNKSYVPLLKAVIPNGVLELIALPDHIGTYTPNINSLPSNLDSETLNTIQTFNDLLRTEQGFDLLDAKSYWYVFRNWQLHKGYQYLPNLEKEVDLTQLRPRIMLFPRKKGAPVTDNNGGPWDYPFIVRKLLEFAEVVIAGHPELSVKEGYPESEDLIYAWDNDQVIQQGLRCDLIITQHSGACILGDYVGVDTLILYNGTPPIKGLDETFRFRRNIKKGNFYFAFDYDEIDAFLKSRFKTNT